MRTPSRGRGSLLRGLRERALSSSSAAAVSVRGLEKRYGSQRALVDLSFEIPTGTFTLAAGPNGAGKSTLLRILAQITRPTRGEVHVLGVDPFGRGGAELRTRVGYLGAEPALYADLSVRENLEFAARLRGVPGEGIRGVLDELELHPVAQRRVRTLSLGYRKRAGLARALLGAPALVLLDEPWSGLDAASARRLSGFLSRRLAAGTTLIVAAHGVRDQLDLFQMVLTIDAGRLGGLGAPRALSSELP
jgi:ABC-type multidrug transport system ATPase subunit